MGSTKGPVEKWHSRTAPTPTPCISARTGYANPIRNIHSVGAGSSENVTTCRQTKEGGASTSCTVRTGRTGEGGGSHRSSPMLRGINARASVGAPDPPFVPASDLRTAHAVIAPTVPIAAASGAAMTRQTAPSSAIANSNAPLAAKEAHVTQMHCIKDACRRHVYAHVATNPIR